MLIVSFKVLKVFFEGTFFFQFKNLLDIEQELPSLRAAAKIKYLSLLYNYELYVVFTQVFFLFSLAELESEISALRLGFREIKQELEFHRTKTSSSTSDDKFVSVMTTFTSVATYNFQELEEQLQEARKKVGTS